MIRGIIYMLRKTNYKTVNFVGIENARRASQEKRQTVKNSSLLLVVILICFILWIVK